MLIPDNLVYADTHEWIRPEDDGTLTIGITDFGQDQLGPLVYVQTPDIGRVLTRGADAGVVESNKTASDVHAPVDGRSDCRQPAIGEYARCHQWRTLRAMDLQVATGCGVRCHGIS